MDAPRPPAEAGSGATASTDPSADSAAAIGHLLPSGSGGRGQVNGRRDGSVQCCDNHVCCTLTPYLLQLFMVALT